MEQAGSLEDSLRTLADIRAKMAALEDRKRTAYTAFARETGKDAPAKAAAGQAAMAQAGAAALAALDQAGDSATQFVQTRANTFFDELADAHKLAATKQAELRDLQDQTLGVLSLGDTRFAAAARAQAEAGAAQDQAIQALTDVAAARNPAWDSRKRTARENQIDHFTYEIRRAKNAVLQADANLAALNTQIAIDAAVVARATADAREAAAKAAASPTEQTRLAVDKAQKAATAAARELAADQKRLSDHPKAVADAIKQMPELEARLAESLAAPEPQPVTPTPQDQRLIALQATAHQLQLEAVQAQQRAAATVAALSGAGSAAHGATTALAALDLAAPAEPVPPPSAPGTMNLAQVYETAVKTESALTQSYRRLRATDLAMIRHLPISRAIELTDVAKALRPDLAGALQATVASGEELPAAREAIQTARSEMDAMVRLASSLLSQAEALDDSAGATVSTDEYNRKFEQWEKMQDLAAEDEGQWAKDLTGAMAGGAGQAGDGNPGGEGGGGSGPGGGGSGGGQPGGAPGAGGPNLGKTGMAGPFGPDTGSGASGSPGVRGGVGGFGKGGIPGAKGAAGAPEDVSDRVTPSPGRRVAAQGPSANWFFVDSWYILGPFDNTNRANIDRKFPPETVIDLNATYPGKNRVPIHWEFQQSSKPNITPQLDGYNSAVQNPAQSSDANFRRNLEYIIYYGYTELWFAKACDLWVAIGSDDSAKVWVEDQLVWVSGKNLKAWSLNEGLRKVHFKQGVNRVLYRVENANSRTEFSMVVSLLP